MPDAPEPLTLYPRSGRLMANGFILLLGCMLACFAAYFHLEEKKIALFYIFLGVALLVFLYVVARFARALRASPALVLHTDGLYEDMKFAPYGLIPWDHVAGAEIDIRNSRTLIIFLVNSEDLLNRMSWIKRIIHILSYGFPNTIRIPSYFFDYDQSLLHNKINEFVAYNSQEALDFPPNFHPALKINKFRKIVLYRNNMLLGIISGIFLVGILWLLTKYHYNFEEYNNGKQYYIKLLIISPLILIWSIGALSRALQIHKPALILSTQGLYDGLWLASYGLIPWEQIESVKMSRAMTLTIRLHDTSAASRNLSWWKVPFHLFFYFSLRNITVGQGICPIRLLDLKKCIELYVQTYSKATP